MYWCIIRYTKINNKNVRQILKKKALYLGKLNNKFLIVKTKKN